MCELHTERDIGDRLGEFLYRIQGEVGTIRLYWSPWHSHTKKVRERWRIAAERELLAVAASCGLKVVPDDGEMK